MMRCCPGREQLQQLLADQLSVALRQELEAHIEACAVCQDTLARLSDEGREFETLPRDPPPLPVPESTGVGYARRRASARSGFALSKACK